IAAGDMEFKLRFVSHGKIMQLGRIIGFTAEDGSPRLTEHPRVEIEHFIAEHRHLTKDYILKVGAFDGTDRNKSPMDCFQEMASHCISHRLPYTIGSNRRVSNLALAEECTRACLAYEPASAQTWNDLAILSLINTLARSMDMLALGSTES